MTQKEQGRDAPWMSIVDFWLESGPEKWFAPDGDFDALCRRRFSDLHFAAVTRRLEGWREGAESVLGLVLLLDQMPRNMYRGTERVWSSDRQALETAEEAIERGMDRALDVSLRRWLYMPFMHSEDMEAQRRSVILFTERSDSADSASYARHHCEIVERFGRFPHRNRVLGRAQTEEERRYLASGGFGGG